MNDVVLTKELIKLGQSDAGGWNRAQLSILGIHEWPLPTGWIDDVVGLCLNAGEFSAFLSLKGAVKNRTRIARDRKRVSREMPQKSPKLTTLGNSDPDFVIYTDGAMFGKSRRGGAAAIILHGETTQVVAAGFRPTSNNRMELMAAIIGLEKTTAGDKVEIISDSQYMVHAFERNWIGKWQKKGQLTPGSNQSRVNYDLWIKLISLVKARSVRFTWVKGHSGDKYNEMADHYADQAANGESIFHDAGYISK